MTELMFGCQPNICRTRGACVTLYSILIIQYRLTKVLMDTDYVDIKMSVASSIKSLHLSGPTAQISS